MTGSQKTYSTLRLAAAIMAIAAMAVAAGAGSGAFASPKAKTAGTSAPLDKGVAAFRDVCLGSAPSFTSAKKRAEKYGVKTYIMLGKEAMGMSPDKSLSIQIEPGRECAVTTQSRPGTTARTQFLQVIAPITGVTRQLPAAGKIGGSVFIFQDDRKGGEAYVMLRK